MRVLVTGADGFVGRHLCAHLTAEGDEPLPVSGPRARRGEGLSVDVADGGAVRALVESTRPDGIVHLAGFSSVARSHQNPARAFLVNAMGAVHLLTAVREHAPKARVLLVGSGEQYGAVPTGERAREELAQVPSSPYAAAKVAAEVAGVQFCRGYGLSVLFARPFNHLGQGQGKGFVVPSFAAQLKAIASGASEPVLRVGNLEVTRDFSHVKDVVAGYRLLLRRGQPGEAYNLCSGTGRTIRNLVDELLELSGAQARIEVDPARLRPAEIPSLVGDPSRLEALGWRRQHTVTQALEDVLAEA